MTVVQHKGKQFFAQTSSFSQRVPDPGQASRAVLIFRLRDLETAPSTDLKWLESFARKIQQGGNRVILGGVEPRVMKVLEHGGVIELLGKDSVFPATAGRQSALDAAVAEGERWINST